MPTKTASGVSDYGYRYLSPGSGRWLSRDPIGENGGMCLYCAMKNRAVSLLDWLGLQTPPENGGRMTSEIGKESLEGLQAELQAMCVKPCLKCERGRWIPTTPEKCREEAKAVAEGIKKTFEQNFDRQLVDQRPPFGTPNTPPQACRPATPDDVGDHLCWDWAQGFANSVNMRGAKSWSAAVGKVEKDHNPADRVHFFVRIFAGKNQTDRECELMVDDGWFSFPTMIHKPPWLPNDQWGDTRFEPPACACRPVRPF